MLCYYFKSRVGTFYIYPSRYQPGCFALEIRGIVYGVYSSAVAAADDVYVHVTGYDPWDLRPESAYDPTDLSEWEIGEISR